FCQAEDGIRVFHVTGVQTCALPISSTIKKLAGSTVESIRLQPGENTARRPATASMRAVSALFLTKLEELPNPTQMGGGPADRNRSEERRVGQQGRARSATDQARRLS